MDELDRLYRRLVQNIRSGAPELLTRSFEVSQIYQQIVPYRTNRGELAFDTNDEYDLAMLQLLAGVRGLLTGDPDMQRALRSELDSSNPDLGAFRVFATAAVMLSPEPLRALEQERQVRSASGAAEPGARESTPTQASPHEQAILAGRATESLEEPVASGQPKGGAIPPLRADTGHAPPRAAAAPARPASPPNAARNVARNAARNAAPDAAPSRTRPDDSANPSAAPSAVNAGRSGSLNARTGDVCRYCAGVLPEGRGIIFCPHCGHNLTVQHCPACGTELEVEWKFCITCGRDVAGEGPAMAKRE